MREQAPAKQLSDACHQAYVQAFRSASRPLSYRPRGAQCAARAHGLKLRPEFLPRLPRDPRSLILDSCAPRRADRVLQALYDSILID